MKDIMFKDILSQMKKPKTLNPCPKCGWELDIKAPCCGNPYIRRWCPVCKKISYDVTN
jgi:hypothetical protein